MSVRTALAKKLGLLMAESSTLRSTPAVEKATALKGKKVGKSTIDRVLKSDTPFNLDDLEALAKVFGVEPSAMLQSDRSDAQIANSPPPLEQALPVVLDAIAQAPERAKLRTAFLALLDDDSTAYRQRVKELLQAPPKTVDDSLVGAPVAPEHEAEVEQLLREAEQAHGKHQRHRASGR